MSNGSSLLCGLVGFALSSICLFGCDPARGRSAPANSVGEPQDVAEAVTAELAALGEVLQGRRKSEDATPLVSRLIARMAVAQSRGQLLSDFFATSFSQAAIPPESEEKLRACLQANWQLAHNYEVLTPQSLAGMREGKSPEAIAGKFLGKKMTIVLRQPAGAGDQVWFTALLECDPPVIARPVAPAIKRTQIFRPTSAPRPVPPNWVPPRARQSVRSRSALPTPVAIAPPEIVQIQIGGTVDLSRFGIQGQQLIVREINRVAGVRFSLVDTTRSVQKTFRYPTKDNSRGRAFTKSYPIAVTQQIALGTDSIPTTRHRGSLLVRRDRVAIYLIDELAHSNQCTIAVISN